MSPLPRDDVRYHGVRWLRGVTDGGHHGPREGGHHDHREGGHLDHLPIILPSSSSHLLTIFVGWQRGHHEGDVGQPHHAPSFKLREVLY